MIADATLDILPKPKLLIGGRDMFDASGGTHGHVYAATGKLTGHIPLAGPEEIDAAVAAARAAAPAWANMLPNERRNILIRFAQLLQRDADILTRLSVIDNGIPLSVAQFGPHVAADSFLYNAGWTDKIGGDVIATWPTPALDYTRDEPFGVVAVIIPWNGPIYALGMVLGPALAAGNTVVVKPPELAPYAAMRFGDLALEAGLPAGVVNIVPGGPAAGAALTTHPGVDKISFTGSGATARHILSAVAPRMTPVHLELGGKSAAVIFDDADLDALDAFSLSGVVNNSGQGCINATRLLVQSRIYDAVVDRIRAQAEQIALGDPMDAATRMGPVIDDRAVQRIMGMIERAPGEGGRLVAGGERAGGALADGYFIQPTVFCDVDPQSELAQHEVFGPVLAISRFDTEEEAVALANGTDFGLAAYVWTRDVKRAHGMASKLIAGNIWVNGFTGIPISAPFGGVGQSGQGRLGGIHGIREYLRAKNVWISL
ncbi:Acyl-CoA reductase [Sphingobium faniae]|nr:Acyl-CoA reductase [Sphingobium faniae]